MNAQFSLPAASVADLGSRFAQIVPPHTGPSVVSATLPGTLAVAISIGPCWLEVSQEAMVTAPGTFALGGLLSPGARYLDGTVSYEVADGRLLMRNDLGASSAEPVRSTETVHYDPPPERILTTVSADVLGKALRALPRSMGKALYFSDNTAFVGDHTFSCHVTHAGLTGRWSLPSMLARLILELVENVDEVQIIGDEERTGIAIAGARLHWPMIPPIDTRSTWSGETLVLRRNECKALAKSASAAERGTIRVETRAGCLHAVVRSERGATKDTSRFPSVGSMPTVTCPCSQFATVFGRVKADSVELGLAPGQLLTREERRGFSVTYALPAMAGRT